MKVHIVAYLFILQLAYVKASPFLSISASISSGLGTNRVFTRLPAASATCFQPRASSDPPASQISSALISSNAVAYACSNITILRSKNHTTHYDALSAVTAAVSKTNGSTRSISSRQSPIQFGAAFSPSTSPTTSIRASATATQDITSRFVASIAPKTEQSNSSTTTKQSSQDLQQEDLVTSISFSTIPTQVSGLQRPTNASLLGSLVGDNGSAKITPISGPLTITPDYTITDAFKSNLDTTSISASNGAVLVYSIRTFSDLANSTGTPILVQTTVSETLASGSPVTFIGEVWVGSGGRFWFPPGIPKPESGGGLMPGLQISPPCIWPFCSGKIMINGGGGGDPEGDPPPPYKPPNPPPDYAPPADGSGKDSDQETQDSNTRSQEDLSHIRSRSPETTTKKRLPTNTPSFYTVSRATKSSSPPVSSAQNTTETILATSFASLSTVSRATKSSSSIVSSSSIPAYGIADISDGTLMNYNLSIADAISAALDDESFINGITIQNGILWAPTGSQGLAWAAQATSPFDLALPTFESRTEATSSLSSTTSMSSQSASSSTGSRMQTTPFLASTRSSTAEAFSLAMAASSTAVATANAKANAESEIAKIADLARQAALARQLASSSAVAAANEPPLITTLPNALTTPPMKSSPTLLFECTQT